MRKFLSLLRKWSIRLVLGFFAFTFLWVLLLRWVNPPITYLQIRENLKNEGPQLREWKDLDKIAAAMPLAVVASEDQHFMMHNGIDFGAIRKAREYNEKQKAKGKEKMRGASTISQQVAKNVFLWPNRSWLRKGLEVYFTGLIELLWSKERILEVYLNVIETGTNVFGVQAAAKKYFKKNASNLSKSEAALLAAAIPSPRKSNPARPSAYLQKRQQHVLKQMRLLGDKWLEKSKEMDLDELREKRKKK